LYLLTLGQGALQPQGHLFSAAELNLNAVALTLLGRFTGDDLSLPSLSGWQSWPSLGYNTAQQVGLMIAGVC
jgi:hypothetical protein